MNLLQKSLIVVILVQLLVVGQLFLVKSEKGNRYYAFLQNPLSVVNKEKEDSCKDNLLITLLLKQVNKKRMTYRNLHFINEHLALLDRDEINNTEYFAHKGKKRTHNQIAQVEKNDKGIRNKIEHNAKRFLGYRYVWGATGPNKFDCSGFTQKVFRNVGINLPRVSREQAKVGKYVSFDALKKGDIVFFDTKHRKTGRVTHVGIYLEDGKFIHASSGGKRVMITSFKRRAFYKNRFLWGRRII